MIKKQSTYILTTLLPFLLWSCLNNPLTLQVRYQEVSGLKQNNFVYFEKNKIGRIQKITYTEQGDYLVEITIDHEFKNAATVDAQFFIDNDPTNNNCKAVIVEQEQPGGAILKKRTIVDGSVRPDFFSAIMNEFKKETGITKDKMNQTMEDLKKSFKDRSRKLDTDLENTIDDLSRKFQAYREEAKRLPDNDEVKQLQDSVNQFADKFNKAQKDVRDQLRDELLPQLQWELDQLREKLKKEGREKEIDQIDQQIKEMTMV